MKSNNIKGITVIHNDVLSWVNTSDHERLPLLSIHLRELLDDNAELSDIKDKVSKFSNTLLVMPDYWFANNTFEIKAKKQSIVDRYVQRKLERQHPDLPEIKNFYSYLRKKERSKRDAVYAYYMLSAESYQVYARLEALGQAPERITTPAYLWQEKLGQLLPDFDQKAVGLICVIDLNAYIYFYFKGFFLFSRNIALPEDPKDPENSRTALTFEVNQSLYLFSQKTKSQPDILYMITSDQETVSHLTKNIDREIKDIKEMGGNLNDAPQRLAVLGAAGYLGANSKDFEESLLAVAHRIQRSVEQWKPVQMTGIFVGICLFIALAVGNILLHRLSQMGPQQLSKQIPNSSASREILGQYAESIDIIMAETKRPAAAPVLFEIVDALPQNMWIKRVSVDVDTLPAVNLQCLIRADDMQQLNATITSFLGRLGNTFVSARMIKKQDIRIETVESDDLGNQQYAIGLEFGLI